jgi:predicted ATPase/signal transduction histidine kinase
MELVHCHIAKNPVDVNEVNSNVPPIVSDIVMKLLAKNAEDRYQSAFGVKADFDKCLENLRGFGNLEGLDFELAQNDFSGKLQIPQKLYGRENEVNTLLQAFERVSQGSAEMMLIAGYSGVGKTALVHEVHKPMTSRRGYFAAGKFDQFQKNIPYSAITQAFNNFCRYLLMENAETLANWQTKILAALGNNGQIIIDVVPDLELVIGEQPAVTKVGPTEAQNRFQLFSLNFIKALCSKEHPFIFFIDDLQWVDSASLGLLKSIMLDDEIQHLLIIGAYRDNEVDGSHPFIMAASELQKANVIINTIFLSNLLSKDVNHLLQDSLKCKTLLTQPLTDLIYQKTQGNAFFTHQFLQTLYEEALLCFDFELHQWRWDVKQIAAQNITANVVELMSNKIDKLPVKTSAVLQLAACIGNQFDLSILAIIYEQEQNETLSVLRPAIVEGLIQPLDKNYKRLDTAEKSHFKFLHDRVQQAAYALIDDEQKKAVHLQIGRLLLENTLASALEEKVFDIVGQFNRSIELLNTQTERLEIAQLNLMAGQKAKMATAYGAAVNYLSVGREYLIENSWESEYDLTLDLYVATVEAEHLNTNYEQAEILSQIVLQHAKTLLDKLKVYEVLIPLYMAKNQIKTALDTALQVLEMLDVHLEKEPPKQLVIKNCYALPEMTAPNKLAAMRLLNFAISPSYTVAPELFPQIVFTMVKLSVEYGNSALSVFGYSTYGLLLCGALGDIESGYQAGQLAISLLDKFNARELKAKSFAAYNAAVHHWKRPAKETIAPLIEGSQSGLETGDVEFVGVTAMHCSSYLLWVGESLETVAQQQKKFNALLQRLKQEYQLVYLNIWQQTVFNLQGLNSEPCHLIGEAFNEDEMLPKLLETNYGMAIFGIYLAKSMLYYLFKDFAQSLVNAELAEDYEQANVGVMVVPIRKFYYSLALLATYPTASADKQPEIISQVKSHQEQMKLWASHAPTNYQHRYDLVEAEKARIFGQIEAIEWYEKAIAGAKENEYIQEEALAYELAAEFYFGRGMEKFAHTYMREAYYRYQQWGALAKVVDLEIRYPQLLTTATPKNSSVNVTTTGTVMSSISTRLQTSTVLDLDSVTKASQTLVGEIVLSKLLEKMMHIVIENAGAERGFLLLPQDEQWVIEAEGAIDNKEITTLHSLPAENHLPEAIISYVARTQENVVLADARQEGIYTENPYIKAHKTQSVLCFPIVYQLKLRAILYLENNLMSGAFTEERLNVLKMLSSQMAISLENAQIMAHLDTKVKERTTQLNAKVDELTRTRHELVQSEKMASLGRLVAGFAHELNTPLGVAIGSASALQTETKKINRIMEQEEVDVDELLSALEVIDKGFDLTLSNLERAANLVTSFKRTAVDQTSDEVRSFHVHEVINDTINTLHNRFKKTDIDIQVDCPNDFKIKSLPGALEQILTNLLMNSLIHGFEQGQQAGSININVQLDENNVLLEYVDTGKGIPKENLAKIFEPFFTTHRAHGGSGLGMYICYNIVTTQLHGTIRCESALDKGVVFKIDYPIEAQS